MSDLDRRLLRDLEREEKHRRHMETFKEDCMRVLFILVGVLLAVMIWTSVRRSMEAAEVQAAETEWVSAGTWKLTAYCPERCCNGKNAHRTASGAPMVVGRTVAVGHLPFGTEIMIDGHVYVVEDRGVRGNHVDILYPDHKSALRHGIQYKEVFIRR